jgi:protein phosphatase
VQADVVRNELKPGQRILLCSDGLNDELEDRAIADIVGAGGSDQEIVDTLINTVLGGSARDNVTVVLISAS